MESGRAFPRTRRPVCGREGEQEPRAGSQQQWPQAQPRRGAGEPEVPPSTSGKRGDLSDRETGGDGKQRVSQQTRPVSKGWGEGREGQEPWKPALQVWRAVLLPTQRSQADTAREERSGQRPHPAVGSTALHEHTPCLQKSYVNGSLHSKTQGSLLHPAVNGVGQKAGEQGKRDHGQPQDLKP